MAEEMTAAEFQAKYGQKKGKKTSKYRAIPTYVDNFRFDSKAEARRYGNLKVLQRSGDVLYFLRQVPMHLEGGVIYRVDFQIFWKDGRVTYEDVKGRDTAQSKQKRRQVEARYPVEILIVR